jgi:hypothetical protein
MNATGAKCRGIGLLSGRNSQWRANRTETVPDIKEIARGPGPAAGWRVPPIENCVPSAI